MSNGDIQLSKEEILASIDWVSELQKRDLHNLNIGDTIIDDSGWVYTISDFGLDDYKKPAVVCKSRYGTSRINLDELSLNSDRHTKYRKLYDSVGVVLSDAIAELTKSDDNSEETANKSTDITMSASKEVVEAHRRVLQEKENKFKVMEWVLKRQMSVLQEQSTLMRRQLKYTEQIITLMELFLGVYEDVVTLRSGKPAPASFPLNIRQLVLYMDEEAATINFFNGDGLGIDFRTIDKFDDWLIADDNNLNLVLPEAKGIVAIKATRQKREYSDNIWTQAAMSAENDYMYLLIRNGENVHRVYTSIQVGDKLFPSQKEMDAIMEELLNATELSRSEEEAKTKEMSWRNKIVLIQGLIERTDIFQPINPGLSLFKSECFDDGSITLIRDAEQLSLGDGKISFKEWKKQVNSDIKIGSRVVFANISHYYWRRNKWKENRNTDGWAYRYTGNYQNYVPEPPKDGVYVVVGEKDYRGWGSVEKIYKVMYLPKREIWDRKTNEIYESTQQVGFYFHIGDEFVLNYDAFDLDDISYYVSNRLERQNYLTVIPMIFALRDFRLAEIKQEKVLVEIFAQRYDVSEESVWDAVEWWKRKTKLQRPLSEDEDKAWRMIRRHLGISKDN
jgi:hypothetical protein